MGLSGILAILYANELRGCDVQSRLAKTSNWGHSSAGRAPALHAGGREFDPPWLHQNLHQQESK